MMIFSFVFVTMWSNVYGLLTTDVLWESCETKICGSRRLNIHCQDKTKILINKVRSGLDEKFDKLSYQNLRRMCMGMNICRPDRFCDQHRTAPYFNVSYTCVEESDLNDSCDEGGQHIRNKKGFIISPHYPAEVSRPTQCRWSIDVPPGHYVHIFLHDIQSTSTKCDGLIFMARDTCGMSFPTFGVCDDSRMNSTISACSTTQILLALANQSVRFWLSYYVLPVPKLSYVSLYDIDITCVVHGKPQFAYSQAYYDRNNTVTNVTDVEIVQKTIHEDIEPNDNSAAYVGIAVGVGLCVILIVIAIICIKRRSDEKSELKHSDSMSVSNSVSDIQKRPLPETQEPEYTENQAKLQLDYSVVADEVPADRRSPMPQTSPTYAEIEECSDTDTLKAKKLLHKRSIGSAVRELPAKPKEEPQSSVYVDIDDVDLKDAETEKSSNVKAKNKKNEEATQPVYAYKKKMSNASNIYAECADVEDKDKSTEKGKGKGPAGYIDMSHKTYGKSSYILPSKNNKDRVNISKRFQNTNQGPQDADKSKASSDVTEQETNKAKKDSLSSDSDSDDDICIVENELYEPFESAKV